MKISETRPKCYMGQGEEIKPEINNTGGSMSELEVAAGSEIKAPKRKRRFTAQYKMEILRKWELCKGNSGAVGELLRSEGLYSSALFEWKRQRDRGALNALSQKRGRKLKKTAEVIEPRFFIRKICTPCRLYRIVMYYKVFHIYIRAHFIYLFVSHTFHL